MTDAIVIGSGPAGASCARFLRMRGIDVTLIERMTSNFNTYHRICGSAVSRKGVRHLRLKDNEIQNRIGLLRLRWPGGITTDIRVRGYIIDRPVLIARLREEVSDSGGEIVTGSVTEVSQDENGCTAVLSDGREFHADYLIGADGAFSVVRKKIFGTEPGSIIKVAESYIDSPPDGNLIFKIGEKYRGLYSWSFPCGSGRTVGTSADLKSEVAGSPLCRCTPTGAVDELINGRAILIGDAGGLANPVSYGGLRTAFESAFEAASAIDKGDLNQYQNWWSNSVKSSMGFGDLHDLVVSMTDYDYSEFSSRMNHRSLYLNGLDSVIHNPKYFRYYIGCLQALRFGW
ncbi:NAD(P)/FAD-dependent oxidoreductase [Candidatus Methanomethylophilus sp. 1R26]|uniref:NAD(P)/FAD-dependent oxidoreductase n=1 Tax=Candidatus Methanomethylophilus sp. 1R26 TaxID=1769296 RepID=UPI0009E83D41|nr:NAD(P)/FAD-dependent oxidoreductase [Candidatus Methanomethylophilus sp. 1R26]